MPYDLQDVVQTSGGGIVYVPNDSKDVVQTSGGGIVLPCYTIHKMQCKRVVGV